MSVEKVRRIRAGATIENDPTKNYLELLGRPSFLKSEDAAIYDGLLAESIRQLAPSDFLSSLRAKELAEKLFEEQRLKRSQAALVNSAMIQSLASLLGPVFSDNHEEALETARSYFGADLARKREAGKHVEELKITMEQIEAHAMFLRSAGLHMMERMASNRETSRNKIIRDHEKRLRKVEKNKRKMSRDKNEF
jgi:hypothetical protein